MKQHSSFRRYGGKGSDTGGEEAPAPAPPSLAYFDRIDALVDAELARPGSRFKLISPIPYAELNNKLVEDIVIQQGVPLVVSGVTASWQAELDSTSFSWQWLKAHFGSTKLINSPRDTRLMEDVKGWNVADFVDYLERCARAR